MLLIAGLALAAGCGQRPDADVIVRRPAEGGTLVMATTLDTPQITYFDKKTQAWEGLDVDMEIARAVARKMGLILDVRRIDFLELFAYVKSGRADFAVNTLTITPARAKDVAFSVPYGSDGNVFLYRSNKPAPTVSSANRLRVGVMQATTGHFFLCYHNVDPCCFVDYESAVSAFEKGKIDAIFYDAGAIRETVRVSKGAYALSPLVTRENYGVAVRKDYPELLAVVNEVIAERREAQ